MSRAYYNEYDRKAAAWLRELIKAGHIADGDVDERSIVDVQPSDLRGYTQCHFFAGIGGWSYALRLAGWGDDDPVWTGSCPCQPFSSAGKGFGRDDPRHLWPAFRRLINRCRPATILGEQVASAAGRVWLAGVFANLEAMGYSPAGADLCSAGVGAPNIRQRLYWVAYAESERRGARRVRGTRHDAAAQKPSGFCNAGGLANADGGQSGNGHLQPGRQHGQQPKNGCAGWLEYATGDGREQRRPESSGGGSVVGCSPCGLGDAHSARSQGRDERGHGAKQRPARAPSLGFWSAFELLNCTDGKARRIEPGSFPLAHGVPGRVGLLRGYGNAINPEVAQVFIQAAREAVALNHIGLRGLTTNEVTLDFA